MKREITPLADGYGRIGSCKKSTSGHAIVQTILAEDAALILSAKPEDGLPSSADGGTERSNK